MDRQEVLEDIRTHPEQHRHTFAELQLCCLVGGALDLSLVDAHSEYIDLGTNGGVRCDVISGPCSCGAWH